MSVDRKRGEGGPSDAQYREAFAKEAAEGIQEQVDVREYTLDDLKQVVDGGEGAMRKYLEAKFGGVTAENIGTVRQVAQGEERMAAFGSLSQQSDVARVWDALSAVAEKMVEEQGE